MLILLPVIFKIVEIIFSCNREASAKLLKFKKIKLYWNLYLRFSLETYLEFQITSLIRLKGYDTRTGVEIGLNFLAIVIQLTLFAFMILSIHFLRRRFTIITEPSFKDKYGELTSGLSHLHISAMFTPFVFMVRRLLAALLFIFLAERNYF